MRALLLFVIGLVFGTAFGFLMSGSFDMPAHDHAGHADAGHDHSALTPWPDGTPAPDLSFELLNDGPTSRNLHIIAEGFDWTPAQVNGPVTAGGHAHVYINGVKIARAYGPWLHIENFPIEGPANVRVTLNANDHSGWSVNGEPLAYEWDFK